MPVKEKRDQKIVVAVPLSTRNRWFEYAKEKHWTVTTLVELAVESYMACQCQKKPTKSRK